MKDETRPDRTWRIAESGWLATRTPEFRQALREEVHMQRFDEGEYTHHIGDGPGGIYCVIEGSFGVYASSDGAGVILGHILRPGAWFGQGPMIADMPRYLAFKAMEPSRILTLSLPSIDRVVRRVPDGQRQFLSLSEYNQLLMTRTISDLLIRKADLRLASVLLRLLEIDTGSELEGPTPCTVTQAELSEMANVSRHTANAVLKRFANEGWVQLGYGRIGLRDAAALRSFALAGQ
ncbi:Crp/Fnr family transcriptional regulator [Salipiger thiooxidans]|uniref:Crp/Fnr family transcriptional regulator n=1 Tax=Salipiger thiooxidans TaxID=282683 RepID=UPI001A8EB0A5|nr:Crp/Fnr family transcriptional regulator [Salipiger thiooxidans]MBN8186099.1 Crp/Fnr family transcriptional regulator [Salipiger thiooxidans]